MWTGTWWVAGGRGSGRCHLAPTLHRRSRIGAPDAVGLALLALVTLLAAVIQGTVGFGFTLLAASFFLLIIGSGEAIPLLVILNLAISVSLLRPLWRHVERALWRRLVLGAVVGLPIGVLLLRAADVEQLKLGVAAVILLFVPATALLGRTPASEPDVEAPGFRATSALGVGSLAGAMTTSLGMPGPVLMLYLAGIGRDKLVTRSIALSFFGIVYVASLALQAVVVGVGAWVWGAAAVLVPVAILGGHLGDRLSRHVSESVFRKVVFVLIAGTGVTVLIETLAR